MEDLDGKNISKNGNSKKVPNNDPILNIFY